MKILFTSDLHGHLPEIAPCDLLLIAGDICPNGSYDRLRDSEYQRNWLDTRFREWLEYIPAKNVVATWGNHDFVGQTLGPPPGLRCTFLVDELTAINDVTIWGSPWSMRYGDWAFMKSDAALEPHWQQIPEGVDILMVHGPAYQILDRVERGDRVGSVTLAKHVERVKPKVFVCGHIHESNGVIYPYGEDERTVLINAAHCDLWMDPCQHPWAFDWAGILAITGSSNGLQAPSQT
jgi:Icc-related predicted phosphoesterase